MNDIDNEFDPDKASTFNARAKERGLFSEDPIGGDCGGAQPDPATVGVAATGVYGTATIAPTEVNGMDLRATAVIPRSTLNFDEPSEAVGRAVNEDDKPNAQQVYRRCMAQIGNRGANIPPRWEEYIRRAVFDAYTLGGLAAKLEAETKHTALAQRSLEARLAVVMPTCIAVAMDACCSRSLFVANEDIEQVWDKYTLSSDVQDGGIQYTLVEKTK